MCLLIFVVTIYQEDWTDNTKSAIIRYAYYLIFHRLAFEKMCKMKRIRWEGPLGELSQQKNKRES